MKEDVVKRISEKTKLTERKVDIVLRAFIKDIKSELLKGNDYEIPTVCKFEIKKCRRRVKNPKTNEWIGEKEFYNIRIKKSRGLQALQRKIRRL